VEMEQAQRELVKEQEWAVVVDREARAVDEWEETALAPDRPATASAQTAGRRSPPAVALPAIRLVAPSAERTSCAREVLVKNPAAS